VAGWRRCDDDGIDLVEDVADLIALVGYEGYERCRTSVHPNPPRLTRTVQPLTTER